MKKILSKAFVIIISTFLFACAPVDTTTPASSIYMPDSSAICSEPQSQPVSSENREWNGPMSIDTSLGVTAVITKLGDYELPFADKEDEAPFHVVQAGEKYGVLNAAYQVIVPSEYDQIVRAYKFERPGERQSTDAILYLLKDEVAQFAVKIKEATGQKAIAMQGQDNGAGWHFSNIAWNFGAEMTKMDSSGVVSANLNTPEFIAALEYVKSLRWTYDVLLDPSTINWGTGYEALGTGTAAMYMAANDGVNQPLNYGLTPDDFAIIPMPAGPGGQYLLQGGTPYMFSPDATPAQINAALDYIEIMGRVPVLSDEVREGLRVTQGNNKEQGIPVLPPFPLYTDPAIIAMHDEVAAEFNNMDIRLWQDYINMMRSKDAIHPEEPGLTQEMYAQILQALQAIFTDANADCAALAKTANDNYQTLLDSYYASL